MNDNSNMNDNSTPIGYLKKLATDFRDKRNWKRYHNPKDLAISISIEAGELLELFQWKNLDEIYKSIENPNYLEEIRDELADIVIYCLCLSDILNIDLSASIVKKIEKNEKKYPIEKYRGSTEEKESP
jgi:NTP pyrophosphatase (non-canonical NTP hydrolase)